MVALGPGLVDFARFIVSFMLGAKGLTMGCCTKKSNHAKKKRELPIYLGPLVYDVESLLERFGYSSGNGSTFDRSA